MKRQFLPLLSLLVLAPILTPAQPPGRGGNGRAGGGGGPLPAEARETIHTLFGQHESIERKVTLTDKGYTARTVSKDPKIAAKIQEHVAAMEKRLDSGFPVRRWDPAFEEFFRHYDQLETTIHKIKNGVEVEVVGKTPEAIKVAQNHAKIISGFVEKGEERHHARHPVALEVKGGEARPAGPGKGCDECKEACRCQQAEPAGAGKGCTKCAGAAGCRKDEKMAKPGAAEKKD